MIHDKYKQRALEIALKEKKRDQVYQSRVDSIDERSRGGWELLEGAIYNQKQLLSRSHLPENQNIQDQLLKHY